MRRSRRLGGGGNAAPFLHFASGPDPNYLWWHARPLHVVPIVFKDSIVTFDMEATSGSTILLGAKPANESTVAANLRRAACVVLGKAALTEWQNFRYTNQPTRGPARRGQCTGAFYPNMKASGSSTGSAVATSLGLAFAGVGAEVLCLHIISNTLHFTSKLMTNGCGACRQMAAFATPPARPASSGSRQQPGSSLAMGPYQIHVDTTPWVSWLGTRRMPPPF